jgi:hypothetical protein
MKKLTRTAKLIHTSPLPGVSSYIFNEYMDDNHKDGFIYEKIVNGEAETVKSHVNEFNQLVSDARKALYQKFLRGVGQFEVEIIENLKYDKKLGFISFK